MRLYCKSFLICDEVYIRANETQTRPHTTSPIQFNSVHKKCFLLCVHRVSCVSIPHHFLLSSLSLSFCRWFHRCTKLIASQLFSVSLQLHRICCNSRCMPNNTIHSNTILLSLLCTRSTFSTINGDAIAPNSHHASFMFQSIAVAVVAAHASYKTVRNMSLSRVEYKM